MTRAFEVSSDDIEYLDARQLTKLLHTLLLLEAAVLGLPKSKVSVGLNIDIPDGGEDGSIQWHEGPDPSHSHWLPSRCNVFQAKATDMGPTACGDEIVSPNGALKPRLQRAADAAGAYILFYGRHCEGKMVTEREEAIRKRMLASVGPDKATHVAVQVYGAEKIAEWTNQYGSAVTYVLRCLRREPPAAFQQWAEWKEEWEGSHPLPLAFHRPSRQAAFEKLRTHLDQPGAVARLVGLSGLGKSRLALEVFAPPEQLEDSLQQRAFSTQCVYINDGSAREREVEDALRELMRRRVRAVIVVDECPLALHVKLEHIVSTSSSQLSLLTLDFEPDSNPNTRRCEFIRLNPLTDSETADLLQATHPALAPNIAARIVSFAQGFPRMIEFLADAATSSEPRLWELGRRDVFKKLVVRRSESPEDVYAVAKALAIFAQIAIYGDHEDQLKVVADEFCDVHDASVMYGLIRNLEKAGIVYRRGDYVRVTPLPLALMLASEWWDGCHESRAGVILAGEVVPQEMVDALCDHLKRLKGHDAIERLVNRILGADSPFVMREQLNSAPGSRLVSSLAEVHPKATCRALTRAFAHLSVAEAKQIVEGRRHLVWAAQKLAWWPETFAEAAWLLLLFGAAENETWGNNATAEFKKLFHVFLSGTEQPPLDRLGVLERGLRSGSPEIERLSVEALVAAFRASDFSRSGGVESQAHGLPREDWSPTNGSEVWDYWQAASQMIMPYVTRTGSLGAAVRSGLARRARGIIRGGALPILEQLIQPVRTAGIPWPEMLGSVREAQQYEKNQLPQATLERLAQVAEQLAPTNLRDRLQYLVSIPGWGEVDERPDGSVALMAETRAQDLGREVASLGLSFAEYLPDLLKGEQRQAFAFGKTLGSHVDDPLALLRLGVDRWAEIPFDERNSAFLMGLCDASAQRHIHATHAYIREQLQLQPTRLLAIELVRAAGAEDGDIVELTNLLRARALPSQRMLPFCLGRALERISDHILTEFLAACRDCDAEGPRVALELLGMRVFRIEIPEGLKGITRSLLISPGLLTSKALSTTTTDQHYTTLAGIVLNWQLEDAQYIQTLAAFIIAACWSDAWDARTVQLLLIELLKTYPDLGWRELRNAVEADDWANADFIRTAVGGFDDSPVDLVSLVGIERLLGWCAEEGRAAPLVAGMTELLRESPIEGETFGMWMPLALMLLDRHGANVKLLRSFSARIHTGTWSGSAVPRLKLHHAAFGQLLAHSRREVVTWAAREVASLEVQIEREKKRDEEQEFGIYR